MTTDITIKTNGRYVSEGTMTIVRNGVEPEVRPISVGPGQQNTPAEERFNIPHNSTVRFDVTEREATEAEVAASLEPAGDLSGRESEQPHRQGGPVGSFEGGEFVERKPAKTAADKK